MTPDQLRKLADFIREGVPMPRGDDQVAVYLERATIHRLADSILRLADLAVTHA